MGIRGLTTFIAKHADKYLETYELHDTYLVIDGNNLACHLYKWHTKCYDCFGGDYDCYATEVSNFFQLLEACNVTPLVILDGGYENKKLSTIYSRVRNTVKIAGQLNSATEGSANVFPLFTRDLFVDVVSRLKIRAIRCDFEADFEMACIARTLNCPVLSYDSDFYVFDVLYVPFSTVELKAVSVKNKQTHIRCRIYKVDNFLRTFGGLSKENLPLLATLLGNDYIKASCFEGFYKHLKIGKRKHVRTEQQRRIESVVRWLQTETFETAVKKILGRVKKENRKQILEGIVQITNGYVCTNSAYLNLLGVVAVSTCQGGNKDLNLNLDNLEECSDIESQATSEDSVKELIAETIEAGKKTILPVLPGWFMLKYRKSEYPAWFLDIALRNHYFLMPQLEDYTNTYSHSVSLDVLRVIHKILTSGKTKCLTYIARRESHLKKFTLSLETSIPCPLLNEVPSLSKETAKKIISDVLEFGENDLETALPEEWKLYVFALVRWVNVATPKITNGHIYALVISALVLKIVDRKIGYCRTRTKYYTVLAPKIEKIIRKRTEECIIETLQEAIEKIDHDDCMLAFKNFFRSFTMDEKIERNSRKFDVRIVDAFAQFQSCLYYIKYLNVLLDRPYEDVVISDFYNGTLIYNVCSNFLKRADLDAYVELFLSDSKTLLSAFKCIVGHVKKAAGGDIPKAECKKRRKRKAKVAAKNADVEVDAEVEEDAEVFDVNNRFSLLKFS